VPAGRRPGNTDTRQLVLDAARDCFASSGYDGATIRAIAATAGVDPALVHHFFGSKAELFAAAMELPVNPRELVPTMVGGDIDEIGERIVRTFLGLWEDPKSRRRMLAVLKSAVRYEAAAAMLRTFLTRELLAAVAKGIDAPRGDLRASLVGSQLVGLAMARYVIKVPPLATAPVDTLVAAYAPAVQRYLTGPLS
jgi:AcrR family transcriptional regulator